ncbi:hypothetical protein MHBO_003449 [Bonamia ostreae]|uniref:Ribosomal protein S3 n=1 Tax=Bonamia ostreae TaxID=126728 RepID=A0ABV2AQG9_9EUKA
MVEEAINFWESQKIIKRTIKKVIFSTPKKKQKIEKRLEKKFESLAKNIIEERDFFRLINVKEEQYFE